MMLKDSSFPQVSERLPHAVLDIESRRKKALKIERLLNLSERKQPIRMLEIGTGSGGIAHYFATHPTISCNVTAVDVVDQRMIHDGFVFTLVNDTYLPFEDGEFDVVLSNHVIEHVGSENAQACHLQEIHRVMSSEGIGYVATPNRWMIIEPHYRLAFLSWLPKIMRDHYVRLSRRGKCYDCLPLTQKKLEYLFQTTGFAYLNICTKALKETLVIEAHYGTLVRSVAKLPDNFLDRLSSVNPTLIYVLMKRKSTR